MSDTRQSLLRDNTKPMITLGFGAVLALMFLLVFIALAQLRSVNRQLSEVVQETNAKIEAAHAMREAIHLRGTTLSAMQRTDDVFERDRLFMDLDDYAAMYRQARQVLLATAMTGAEKDLDTRLGSATREAQPVNEYAADLLRADPRGQDVDAAVADAAHKRSVLLHLLDELVTLERANADQTLLHSQAHYLDARNIMFLLAGAALALGVLIASVVIRQASLRNRQISYHACHDRLTGLVNRHELEVRVQQAIQSAQRDGAEHALLFLDLDRFKLVNDTCGHFAGDELLRQLTKLLTQGQRRTDTFGRLGGDEFALLLEYCPVARAADIAETLRRNIEAFRFAWDGKTFTVSASIGVVPINDGSQTLEQILCTADTACYMAKQSGRNRVHTARHGDRDIINFRSEVQIANQIRDSLEHDRFVLHGQAIVPTLPLGDERPYIEILIRMTGKQGAVLPPGAFIPAAERYNLMPAIDRWVIRHALNWLAANAGRANLPTLMINLSGQSLCDDKFLGFVLATLDATSVAPHQLCFEITETSVVANFSRARRLIDSLKRRGCAFALDDFGSGFSSFAYLKRLPVDYLKIDGTFVKDIVESPIDFAMVKAINEIGQVLEKKTIAEFVENDAILEKLRNLGVDFAQGYGVSRPQPLDAFILKSGLPVPDQRLAVP